MASRRNENISDKEVVNFLKRKKSHLENVNVLDKLRKKEKLTSEEFWRVYELLQRNGPAIKYQNPDGWIIQDKND